MSSMEYYVVAVKEALGIDTMDMYHDNLIMLLVKEVRDFLQDAGVAEGDIGEMIVARGVADLWDFGSGSGKFSEYFMQRAKQLALRGGGDEQL